MVASVGEVLSNQAVIQWVYDDTWSLVNGLDIDGALPLSWEYGPNLVEGTSGLTTVRVFAGFTPWNGRSLLVYAAPGGNAMSQARTYVESSDLTINLSSALGQAFFVNASNSSNSDGRPNWVYDVAP